MAQRNPRAPLCTAKAKSTGRKCTRPAIRGGTVCRFHGGAAPQVKAKAEERLKDLIDPDRALREAARLAYSDITELFDERGRFLPMKDWPKHIRAAVSSMEVVKKNITAGDGKVDEVLKIRVWDKPKNVELLFRHLGMLKERLEVKLEGDIVQRLHEARKRVAGGKSR